MTLTNNNSYLIKTKATDQASNTETPSSGNSWTFDTEFPVSVITAPSNGAKINGGPNSILGTGSDNIAVGQVKFPRKIFQQIIISQALIGLQLQKHGLMHRHNFMGKDKPKLGDGVTYQIRSKAIDTATNEETPGVGNSFTIMLLLTIWM